eukprot:6277893-Alexandrium_andersonii.AAC.1
MSDTVTTGNIATFKSNGTSNGCQSHTLCLISLCLPVCARLSVLASVSVPCLCLLAFACDDTGTSTDTDRRRHRQSGAI